jgi:hypothetical protein
MENLNEPDLETKSDNSSTSQNEPANNTSQSSWEEFSEDDKKYIGDKGWKATPDILKSYRELEKSYGTKISIPKDEDSEGWNKLYTKLGRPETAEDYEFEADESIKAEAKKTFFELGFSNKQSSKLVEWFNNIQTAQREAIEKQFEEQSKKEKQEVISQWGDDAVKNKELMTRGARLLSQEEDDWHKIEGALGTKKFMQVMVSLGEKISEDSLPSENKTPPKKSISMAEYINKVFEGEV